MILEGKYYCDFCGGDGVLKEDYKNLMMWQGGNRGKKFPLIPTSGFITEEVKHSCPNEVCQAKLFVWTRS